MANTKSRTRGPVRCAIASPGLDHERSSTVKDADEGTVAEARDKTPRDGDIFPRGMHRANGDAGIELQDLLRRPTSKGSTSVICVDYDADHQLVQEIEDLPAFIQRHRPEWSNVRWSVYMA